MGSVKRCESCGRESTTTGPSLRREQDGKRLEWCEACGLARRPRHFLLQYSRRKNQDQGKEPDTDMALLLATPPQTKAQRLPALTNSPLQRRRPGARRNNRALPRSKTPTHEIRPQKKLAPGPRSLSPTSPLVGFETSVLLSPNKLSPEERLAKNIAQRRQMERLSTRPESGLFASIGAKALNVFHSSDHCKLPYEVLGQPCLDLRSFSLVVCHDIFDTMDSTRIFFQSIVRKHQGCQILVYNYAGQAATSWPCADNNQNVTLHAEKHSQHLNELLKHISTRGEMLLAESPFWFVGIGMGLQIALRTARTICGSKNQSLAYHSIFRKSIRGILSINGFARVDDQLAATLRSALAAFRTFPQDRPDLPVSYMSKYIFSDEYLDRVHPRLALNIYTAVSNPITLEGRLALLNGALADIPRLQELPPIPFILLHSTLNTLVPPCQVNSLLSLDKNHSERHAIRHLWSHQLDTTSGDANAIFLGSRGRMLVRDIAVSLPFSSPNLACVIWVKAGHELRQELGGSLLIDLLNTITPCEEHNAAEQQRQSTANSIQETPLEVLDAANEQSMLSIAGSAAPLHTENTSPPSIPQEEQDSIESRPPSPPKREEVLPDEDTSFTALISRLRADDFSEGVRSALINDVASSLSKLIRLPVPANKVEFAGSHPVSGEVNVSILGIPGGTARSLNKLMLANMHQPFLPAYWGPHKLTAVPARGIALDWKVETNEDKSESLDNDIRNEDECFEVEEEEENNREVPSDVDSVDNNALVNDRDNDLDEMIPSEEKQKLESFVEPEPLTAVCLVEPITTKEQRESRRYAQDVEPAAEAIDADRKLRVEQVIQSATVPQNTEELEERDKERQFREMQRESDVDGAELILVRSGLAPPYEPPPGQAAPVLRLPPTEYKVQNVPENILRDSSVLSILEDRPAPSEEEHRTAEAPQEDESTSNTEAIKREMATPQLLRESYFLEMFSGEVPY